MPIEEGRQIHSTAKAALAMLAALAGPPATASEIRGDDFTAYVTLTSDYVFRGTSQTREDAALQLGLDFEHESGLFAGIWGSNVEFPPVGPFEDPRDVEIQLYAGYGVELGRRWGLAATLSRYAYPGGEGLVDWDYNEVGVTVRRREAALSVAYSDSALGSGEAGVALDLTDRWNLGKKLALAAGVGFYDLDAPFLKDYWYWSAELSRRLGRASVSLGYFDTDSRGEEVWGDRAAARLVGSVSYGIH